MPLEMIHRDQRLAESKGKCLGVQNADQQRAGQTWSLRHGHGIEVVEADARLLHRRPDDRDDVAEMFARGQFGDDAAIRSVQCDLAGNHIPEHIASYAHYGRRSLVATAFDTENEAAMSVAARCSHLSILKSHDPIEGDASMVLFPVTKCVPKLELVS